MTGGMNDAQNLYVLSSDPVRKKIGKAGQNKLSCARHSAGAPSVWQQAQTLSFPPDAFNDHSGGVRIVLGDELHARVHIL